MEWIWQSSWLWSLSFLFQFHFVSTNFQLWWYLYWVGIFGVSHPKSSLICSFIYFNFHLKFHVHWLPIRQNHSIHQKHHLICHHQYFSLKALNVNFSCFEKFLLRPEIDCGLQWINFCFVRTMHSLRKRRLVNKKFHWQE